ncbi:MAG: Tyrosine recombinase XerC, partial [Negativicoccus succinicivorans DORA_17_25]
IFKASNEISKRFDFNIIQQRALIDELYKCTKNVEIIFLHQEESDFLTYIDIYIKSKQLEGLSPGTLKNKKYMLNELNSYLTKKIEDISVADLKMYVLYKQSTCKTNSLNSIIICIKSFFKFLCEEDYLDNDPSRKLKKIKQEKRLKKSLNEITFEQIRLSCSNVRDRALLEFLYSTGVRVSELISINKDDLNYESNTLRVIGKGNKERVVIFSDITKFYLNKYLASRSDDNPALFVSVKKPYKRLSQRGVQKIFDRIKKDLNLSVDFTPHILRHTFATKLAQTADITTVQKLLGHTSLDTTMIYAEIDNEKIAYQYK